MSKSSDSDLGLEEIAARLNAHAGRWSDDQERGGRRGDSDLNPGMGCLKDPPIPASVLVPLVERPAGLSVILTRRTAHLSAHAGQISFPGGRWEPADIDVTETALRETEEEIGVPRHKIDVMGRLDLYVTRTGYAVTPVVGRVLTPFETKPDPGEVDEVFEVPLRFLLNRANHQRHSRDIGGVKRSFYAMPYDRYYIWGATAGMIVNLADVLEPGGPDG